MSWIKYVAGSRVRAIGKAGSFQILIMQDWNEGPYNWFICPDDEDKCHERSFLCGSAGNLDHAVQDCWHGIVKLTKQIYLDIGAEALLTELHRKP